MNFYTGDRVQWTDRKGVIRHGVVVALGKRHYSVSAADGGQWRIPPAMLTASTAKLDTTALRAKAEAHADRRAGNRAKAQEENAEAGRARIDDYGWVRGSTVRYRGIELTVLAVDRTAGKLVLPGVKASLVAKVEAFGLDVPDRMRNARRTVTVMAYSVFPVR